MSRWTDFYNAQVKFKQFNTIQVHWANANTPRQQGVTIGLGC